MTSVPGRQATASGNGRGIAGRSSPRRACGCSCPAGRSSPGGSPDGAGCCSAPSSWPRGPGSWPGGRGCPGFFAFAFLVARQSRRPTRSGSALVPGLSPADGRADDRRVALAAILLYCRSPVRPCRTRLAGLVAGPDAERIPGECLGVPAGPAEAGALGLARARRRRGRLHAAGSSAAAGQEVEWTGRLAGQRAGSHSGPPPHLGRPSACRFQGPRPTNSWSSRRKTPGPRLDGPLVLVAQDQIIGRAWAQYYPVWDGGSAVRRPTAAKRGREFESHRIVQTILMDESLEIWRLDDFLSPVPA